MNSAERSTLTSCAEAQTWLRSVAGVFAMLTVALPARAQVTAAISGKVLDRSGRRNRRRKHHREKRRNRRDSLRDN